ncbi:MAG: hypothetical protein ACT4QC_12245 [Planctomycetaceae bacterium]
MRTGRVFVPALLAVLFLAPRAILPDDSAANVRTSPPAGNPFLDLLWLVQVSGTPAAADPARDALMKTEISALLRRQPPFSFDGVREFMSRETFDRIAGTDGRLELAEVREWLETNTPHSRQALFPKVAAHTRWLTTGFDLIDQRQLERGSKVVDWLVANYRRGEPLKVVCVCTGNSRRSLFTATLGNVAASYCGLPEVRFYSGGTAPTAFNSRTIASLREIGVDIEPTGNDAARGPEGTPNAIYRVRWGESKAGAAPLEMLEYSKRFDAPDNPQDGFAALMVCSDADEACPTVTGAAIRISLPYLDPKLYDGTEFEARKYAERRDDIGRLLLAVLMQARRKLTAAGKL